MVCSVNSPTVSSRLKSYVLTSRLSESESISPGSSCSKAVEKDVAEDVRCDLLCAQSTCTWEVQRYQLSSLVREMIVLLLEHYEVLSHVHVLLLLIASKIAIRFQSTSTGRDNGAALIIADPPSVLPRG